MTELFHISVFFKSFVSLWQPLTDYVACFFTYFDLCVNPSRTTDPAVCCFDVRLLPSVNK